MKLGHCTTLWSLDVVIAAAASAAIAQTNVDERLKSLEQSVKTLQQENKDLKSQLGWDGKNALVVVKPCGKESKITLGGLLQAQAEFGNTPDARFSGIEDRFLLRRARVNLAGSFLEHFDFKIETDLGANSVSEKSSLSAQITDAFVNWNRYEAANIKIGQFKTPFGYEQLVPDPKVLTVERTLPNDRLTDSRQIGVGVAGDFAKKRFGYSAGAFNGTSVNSSFNDNDAFMLAGRIYGVPVETKVGKQDLRWTVAVNGLTTKDNGTNGPASLSKSGFGFDADLVKAGNDNCFIGDRNAFGVDTQFKWGRFDLYAEYLRAHFEPANAKPFAAFDADGWYVMGAYYLVPQKLQALVRYEAFDPNVSVANDDGGLWTLGLTYYVKGDDLKFMVNYLLGSRGAGFEDQGRLLARVQVVF